MGTRAQKIMSLLKEKTNENSNVSDQQLESPPSHSASSPPVSFDLESSFTSSFTKKTSVQQESELLDIMNLEFIDHKTLNFVVKDNGLLSYVSPECNVENDYHTPNSDPDYIPLSTRHRNES